MRESATKKSEAERLETLWGGDFGNDYVERNTKAGDVREPFWRQVLTEFPVASVLEVGCNLGTNLRWIAPYVTPERTYGVDINVSALRALRQQLPDVNALLVPARELPFRDCWFDLVFTMGLLIHQPDSTLPLVMAEIVRCSRRYVLCGEYFAEKTIDVTYRGQSGALFKRNYGAIYRELFPALRLLKQGFLGREQGWDDVTYWVFQRP